MSIRILIEALPLTLSKRGPLPGRCSFRLERGHGPAAPLTKQWSLRPAADPLRMRPTLLEFEGHFDGSH